MGDTRISARISKTKKNRIKMLVKKGVFKNQSAFLRMAVDRLLEEIEEVRLTQKRKFREVKETESRLEDEQKRAMRDIVDFVDELGD